MFYCAKKSFINLFHLQLIILFLGSDHRFGSISDVFLDGQIKLTIRSFNKNCDPFSWARLGLIRIG